MKDFLLIFLNDKLLFQLPEGAHIAQHSYVNFEKFYFKFENENFIF